MGNVRYQSRLPSLRGVSTRTRSRAVTMSASNSEHPDPSSSSSLGRKRNHPGDSPGSQPNTKVTKRASVRRFLFLTHVHQSFLSSKSAGQETKRPRKRSPSDGSPLLSAQPAAVCTAYISLRPRLRASRRSTSMARSSSRNLSKWGVQGPKVALAVANA